MGKKILIADDEKETRSLIRYVLKKEGFIVIEVNDGQEALRKVDEELPDLIILDVMMPKLDGRGVLLQLKGSKKTKDIPVIISSGQEKMRDFFRANPDIEPEDYLEKPFKIKMLLEKHRDWFQYLKLPGLKSLNHPDSIRDGPY